MTRYAKDPRTLRALAHPLRLKILAILSEAGSATATEIAAQLDGASVSNCSFHLRTLAKYGYVEDAGGGHGRERPWRINPSNRPAQIPFAPRTGTEVRARVGREAADSFRRCLT